jgi:hypothetical protein
VPSGRNPMTMEADEGAGGEVLGGGEGGARVASGLDDVDEGLEKTLELGPGGAWGGRHGGRRSW